MGRSDPLEDRFLNVAKDVMRESGSIISDLVHQAVQHADQSKLTVLTDAEIELILAKCKLWPFCK